MSGVAAAVERIERAIAARVQRVAPFRAVVTAVDGGLIELRRVGATAAEARKYASCSRFLLAVNDEVLVASLNGEPVVIDRINRAAAAAPTFAALAAAGSTASTSGSEGDDESGIIQLVPGGTGITTGSFLDVQFATARPSSKFDVQLTPASSAARTAGATVGPTGRSTSKFSLTTGTALTSGSTYQWFYRTRQYGN